MKNNYSAINYNSQVLEKLREICNPLFFGSCIKSFRYFRIFEDGSYLNLSTNHEWLHERILKIPNNGYSFHKALCSAQEDALTFFLWEDDSNDGLVSLFKKHNIFNGITIYKRDKRSVEGWCFGATLEESLASNFYINNLEYLKKFICYFNNQAKFLIDLSEGAKLAQLREEISLKSFELQKQSLSFTNNFIIKKKEKYSLASRELQCLALLSSGKSYKEVAHVMAISPRTVETHIINIRKKLKENSKSKIIDFYWNKIYFKDFLPEKVNFFN